MAFRDVKDDRSRLGVREAVPLFQQRQHGGQRALREIDHEVSEGEKADERDVRAREVREGGPVLGVPQLTRDVVEEEPEVADAERADAGDFRGERLEVVRVAVGDREARHRRAELGPERPDHRLGIEGEDLDGVHGSTETVSWYNGDPEVPGDAIRVDGAAQATASSAVPASGRMKSEGVGDIAKASVPTIKSPIQAGEPRNISIAKAS